MTIRKNKSDNTDNMEKSEILTSSESSIKSDKIINKDNNENLDDEKILKSLPSNHSIKFDNINNKSLDCEKSKSVLSESSIKTDNNINISENTNNSISNKNNIEKSLLPKSSDNNGKFKSFNNSDIVISDNYILSVMLNKKGQLNANKCHQTYLQKHPELKDYLDNRYIDFDNYSEVIYRIQNNIEIRPCCLHCGNRVAFYKPSMGFQKYCCRECADADQDIIIYDEPVYTDEIVLDIILRKNSEVIDGNKVSHKYFSSHPKLKEYLDTRYGDSDSIAETVYRIKNHIESRPVCKQCGNKVSFTGMGFSDFCSCKCSAINKERLEKQYATNMERFGVKCVWEDPSVHAKCVETTKSIFGNGNNHQQIKETMMERHGVEYPAQDPSIFQKIIETTRQRHGDKFIFGTVENIQFVRNRMREKYGVDNCAQVDEIYRKHQQTMIERHGVQCALQNGVLRDKGRETQKIKYNGLLFVQSKIFKDLINNRVVEINDKKYETMRKNDSFGKSKIEDEFGKYLQERFGDDNVKNQYRCERYPWRCDFYIESLDLFVEIQGYYTHGRHPYNNEDKDDQQTLEKLVGKGYKQVVETWTVRDVLKRKTAQKNRLNYLEIFSCELDECIGQLNKFLKEQYNYK